MECHFIIEFRDNVYWKAILHRQKLSDILILECWDSIAKDIDLNKIGDGLGLRKKIEYKLFQSQLGMSLLIL